MYGTFYDNNGFELIFKSQMYPKYSQLWDKLIEIICKLLLNSKFDGEKNIFSHKKVTM